MNPIAYLQLRPGYSLAVYHHKAQRVYRLYAAWNGANTLITYEQLETGRDPVTMALRSLLHTYDSDVIPYDPNRLEYVIVPIPTPQETP